MKILAIIPARGGSEEKPSLDLKLLGGKPLIAYTIIEALKVKEIDRVIVSTDSSEIAKISKEYGAEVPFLRPKELAEPTVQMEIVLKHALDTLEEKEGYKPDAVILLKSTSPLRKARHIREAIKKYMRVKCGTLTTICDVLKLLGHTDHFRAHRFYRIDGDSPYLIPLHDKREIRREITPFYFEVGAICMTSAALVKAGKIFGENIGYLLLDPVSSINIDRYLDLEIAEKYLKKSQRRKICVITGTRADYGKLLPILKKIREDNELELSIIATGMHLLDEFGYSAKEIEADGFFIDAPVRMVLDGDDVSSMIKSFGIGVYGISQAIEGIKPDIILVQGDRSEALIGAMVGAFSNIPVAHIEGGEVTGTIDESIRHAITKFAHIHFAANQKNADRILKLGERKECVFVVGSPDLDVILNEELFTKEEVEKKLNIDLSQPTLIVLQHPITTERDQTQYQIKETLEALAELALQTVLIYPNADTGGREMIKVIKKYEVKFPWLKTFPSINFKLFLSLMKHASLLVGNSSAGIREAPSFKLPAVNIGTRQIGREQSKNVINVNYHRTEIKKTIEKAMSPEFKKELEACVNIYGDGKASERMVKILKEIPINTKLIQKTLTY